MDQYKAIREQIALLVNERVANNRLLLAIAFLILGGEGFIIKDIISSFSPSISPWGFALLVIAGIAGAMVSFTWYRWNKSYKQSLKYRYDILREIETAFPFRPFAREMELRSVSYVPVSDVISDLALMFLGVFMVQLLGLAFFAWWSACG